MASGIVELYRKRARNYDIYAKFFHIVGLRRKAIEELCLRPGDTVIDIGCGTGLNFQWLQEKVGKEGKIIGIDITDAMLAEAKKKVEKNGWMNVELVLSDAEAYVFPEKVDGIISSFAITLIPEYDDVIRKGAEALVEHKRFVILDFKKPSKWPMWLVKLAASILVEPFGGTLDMAERHPWESVKKYLKLRSIREYYFGSVYIVSGEKIEKRL